MKTCMSCSAFHYHFGSSLWSPHIFPQHLSFKWMNYLYQPNSHNCLHVVCTKSVNYKIIRNMVQNQSNVSIHGNSQVQSISAVLCCYGTSRFITITTNTCTSMTGCAISNVGTSGHETGSKISSEHRSRNVSIQCYRSQ